MTAISIALSVAAMPTIGSAAEIAFRSNCSRFSSNCKQYKPL
jgi:hypothetical protein